jgi:glycerol-3-phosphate acyltransferase PlsY
MAFVVIMIILGYLFGSINSAIVTCRLMGLPSPYTIGSGNPGATNVLRLGGKPAAVVTLAGDLLKGLIPVILAHLAGLNGFGISLVAIAAVIGHIWPIFFGFKGGKGVATLVGVMLGFNWLVGLCFIIVWLITAGLFRFSSLASMVAGIIAPFVVYALYAIKPAIVFAVIAIIIIGRHYENIQRLLNGSESQIGKK